MPHKKEHVEEGVSVTSEDIPTRVRKEIEAGIEKGKAFYTKEVEPRVIKAKEGAERLFNKLTSDESTEPKTIHKPVDYEAKGRAAIKRVKRELDQEERQAKMKKSIERVRKESANKYEKPKRSGMTTEKSEKALRNTLRKSKY